MRNLPRNLLSSWLAVLLVLTVACTKPNFVRTTNGAGGGGASGGAGDYADAGGGGGDTDAGGGGVAGSAGGAGVAGGAGGVGGAADAGGVGGAADAGFGPEARMTCPAPNLACSASSTTGICDPVCQTGGCDWCTQKCTYAPAGALAQATCAGKGKQTVSQPCQVFSLGSATQNDNCAPGSICLQPIGAGYCFSLCHSSIDCLSAVDCGQRTLYPQGPLVGVCDPSPYDQCGPDGTCCDPLALPAASGCATSRFCLLVSPDLQTGHSRTVCEFSSGGGQHGTFCTSAHDCMTANTCVNNRCWLVCDGAHPCPPNGGTCTAWGAEYSYCLE